MKHIKSKFSVAFLFTCSLFTTACSSKSDIPNTLTDAEKSAGWELLFDGKKLDQWHLYNNPNSQGTWYIEDGQIKTNPDSDNTRADLISNKDYENYELKFEWKLAKEGNSGVFINVLEHDSLSTAWLSGPEYQLLEDNHPDFDKPLKRAGCLYGFTPQKNFVNTKKTGEWNESKIIQQDGSIQFYLNDVLTAQMDFNSPQWKEAIAKSSFKDKPQFGVNTKGKLALQDWANGVSFRNIKIKQI